MAKKAALSRDLTKLMTGSMNIRIYRAGTRAINLPKGGSLATYVARAYTVLTGKTIDISDPVNSPFEIVSFDEAYNTLLVQLVREEM